MSDQLPDPNTYEGDEGAPPPAVPPPVHYQPDASVTGPMTPAATPPPPALSHQPTTGDRLAAVSGPLSLILFFVCGFALDGWAWSWIFFLLPGVVYAWNRGGHHGD